MTLEDAAVAVRRDQAVSTEPEEARAMLAHAFAAGLSIERSGRVPFEFQRSTVSDGVITVSSMRIAGRVTAATDGSQEVLFTDVAEGDCRWRSREHHGDHARPLILPSRHPLAVEFEAVRSASIALDAPTASRWLLRHGGLAAPPTLLHRATAGSGAVREAVRSMARIALTEAFDSDLVRAGLLDVLLSTTAHHLLADAPSVRSTRAPAALRRAEEHLRAHAAEPVSIADAAEAARLSIRGLHDQFRRWRGSTPAQYLREVRLEHARADLIAARDEATPASVAEIARRWGFAHAGRFSATYAEAFGERPSATLRH